MMDKDYRIERMTEDEVGVAIAWAKEEGWNPGLHDAQCFYQADPHGFFAGKLKDKIIAVGSAVAYDDNFAFFGLYVVDKLYRNQGYGLELTKATLAYTGDRNVGLDGVLDRVDSYARLGYQYAHNNARYCLEHAVALREKKPEIMSLSALPFEQLLAYDRQHFPALRPNFLRHWIQQPQSVALGFVRDEQLQGYGVLRQCYKGYKIGPLFADSPEIAESLFLHLLEYAQGQQVFLDIPENNPEAFALVNRFGMNKVFATARMYLKDPPTLKTASIYGITTFELG